MGGRIGARMDVLRNDRSASGLGAGEHPDEAPDDGEEENLPSNRNQEQIKISREPEREPSKDPNFIEEQKFQGRNKDPFGENQYNIEDDGALDDQDGQIN